MHCILHLKKSCIQLHNAYKCEWLQVLALNCTKLLKFCMPCSQSGVLIPCVISPETIGRWLMIHLVMTTVTCHSSERTKLLGWARTNLILVIRPFARYGKNGQRWGVLEMREVGLEWNQKEKRPERKRNLVNEKGAGEAECAFALSTVLIFPSMVFSKVSVLSNPDTLNLPFVRGEAPNCRDARWGGTGQMEPACHLNGLYSPLYALPSPTRPLPPFSSASVGMSRDPALWDSPI